MSDLSPLVSVIIAVRNGERYLEQAISSILSQTFRDFECIVIDDASTDATHTLVSGFANDSRIKLITNRTHLGLTRSLNVGLRAAKGEWIARLDADDVWCAQKLETQLECLCASRSIGLCGTFVELIDDHGQSQGFSSRPTTHSEILAQALFSNPFVHSSVMFRRNIVDHLGGYDERYERAQDYALWWRMLLSGVTAINIGQPLTAWRQHGDRVTLLHADTAEVCRTEILRKVHCDWLRMNVQTSILQDIRTLRIEGKRPLNMIRLILHFRLLSKRFGASVSDECAKLHLLRQIDQCLRRTGFPRNTIDKIIVPLATGKSFRRVALCAVEWMWSIVTSKFRFVARA